MSVAVRRSHKNRCSQAVSYRHLIPLGTLLPFTVTVLVAQKYLQPSAEAAEDVEGAKREHSSGPGVLSSSHNSSSKLYEYNNNSLSRGLDSFKHDTAKSGVQILPKSYLSFL